MGAEVRIFKDERVFQPDFLPDELLHRERELREMAISLRSAASGKRSENLLLVGPAGTGKTSSARAVLKQLSEYSQRPLPLYVNCWEISTRFGVLSELAEKLETLLPRRGIAADEVMRRVVEAIKYENKAPVIVLDEIDRLFVSKPGEEMIIYDLVRACEIHSVQIALIGITNDTGLMARMEQRMRSSFSPRVVEFRPYSITDLKDILKERALLAFFPDALDREVIPLCAAIGAKSGGDCRVALNALWQAGREAEAKNSQKVLVEHVKAVKERAIEMSRQLSEKKAGDFDELDTTILGLLKKKEMESGELYKALAPFRLTDRALRLRLERLEELNTIESEKKGAGKVFRIMKGA
jgi:cell division control protein 6